MGAFTGIAGYYCEHSSTCCMHTFVKLMSTNEQHVINKLATYIRLAFGERKALLLNL